MKKLLLLFLVVMAISCQSNQRVSANDGSLMELAQNRRSIRSYTDEPINRETLDSILTVAALAPSSYGQNPVEFVLVEDKALLKQLASCKSIGAPSVKEASAAVVVMADTEKGELWVEDCSVAAAYLLLAAEEKGIGACWNQIHLRDGKKESASKEICKLLGVPLRYEVVCVVAMGHKGENKEPHSGEVMRNGRIHYNKFK